VRVLLSLATATMAPGPMGSLQGVWALPRIYSRLPRRSFSSVREFFSVASPEIVPERTRKSESCPAKGSASVLKTKQDTGPLGSGARSAPSRPAKGGRSRGDGSRASMAVSTASPPLFSSDEQASTGASSPLSTPDRRPVLRSSSERRPSSRYFSMSSSSLSAMFSTVTSRSRLTSSASAAGISASAVAPFSPNMRALPVSTSATPTKDSPWRIGSCSTTGLTLSPARPSSAI